MRLRYQVSYRDPITQEFVITGRLMREVKGEGSPEEIVSELEEHLGSETFDREATLRWLETAVAPAILSLNQDQQLEIAV